MKCNITPCNWHWCNKNQDCYLHKLESGGKMVQQTPKYYTHGIIGKVGRGKRLRDKLKPFVEGITKEDNLYKCHYCKIEIIYTNLTADHKIPLSKGGSNDISNLVPCCKDCNHKKGNRNYNQFIKDLENFIRKS